MISYYYYIFSVVKNKPIGTVIGIDLLPIDPLNGAVFLPGCDFTSSTTQDQIRRILSTQENKDGKVDVILSDMAPNASGIKETDHYRIIKLASSALEFALSYGKLGSHFLAKVWDGADTKKFEQRLTQHYKEVSRQKPNCSRNDSAEIFLLGKYKIS